MRLDPGRNRIDLVLSAEGLKDDILQRVRFGFFG